MLLSGQNQYQQHKHRQASTQPRHIHTLDYDSLLTASVVPRPEQTYAAAQQQSLDHIGSASSATHRSPQPAADEDCLTDLSQLPDLMPSDPWSLSSHYTHKALGRMPHQRESSLSSLGSAGPASPFNHAASNPHIAISDPANDGFNEMQHDGSSSYYQLAKAVGGNGMFSGYHSLGHTDHPEMGYPAAIALQRPRTDKINLLPAPDFGNNYNRSHPNSVASSTVGGDSPATPTLGEPADEDRRRTRTTLAEPPKLDRTMTDIYSDELYNPSFTITSASPSHQQHLAVSPSNDLFAQRLSAANTQHLSANQSPTSTTSRDRSPFRHGSPLAPMSQDFGSLASSRLRFNSAHQIREHDKAAQDALMMKQQMAVKTEADTPKTISPKDAMLDFPGPDNDSVFPSLFPSQETASDFGTDGQTSTKMSAPVDQLAMFPHMTSNESYQFTPQQQLHSAMQIPQHYPFVAHARQSHPRITPNLSSTGSSDSSVSTPVQLTKPAGTTADGGTYTCTYHGCTLRFETPALLQKHKREGHRQPHSMGTVTRHSEVTSPASPSFLNTQAGPHRCDRINPSTGKPCSTIFSRPYDLTRHEDTIHNARKQKVRCNLCTEEKTFSRADALTRHYRVCHPDVELPGKYRRRGNQG